MTNKEEIEQRKLVPVAAMVSAGKSYLLNVLYNINFLYCQTGIGTKFVNILRYNPKIEKPCFYHLKLEKKDKSYIFYKDIDKEIYEGEENIIEANKNINESLRAELETKFEDLFYMTEIKEVPFIKDKEYLLTHDLVDIPGLSEYQSNKANEKEKEKEEKIEKPKETNNIKDIEFEKELQKGAKEFGLVLNMENDLNIIEEKKNEKVENNNDKDKNIEEDIYSKIDIEHEHTYLTEIFKIIKNSIDGAIIILSIENYQKNENYEIIAKLHKVIGKEITNFLIILNKMDLSLNPINDIQKCKGLLIQKFQKFQTFNINLNTFIPLSVEQLKNELLMENSFKHLINYHFYNYMSKKNEERNTRQTSTGKSFIDHLTDIIRTVGGIKKEEIESKIEELNQREDIDNINKQIIEIINDIKNRFSANKINLGISEQDFVEAEEEDLPDPDTINITDIDICNLNPTFIIKYFYYCFDKKDKLLMPTLSTETINLLNYFSFKKEKLKLDNKINNDDKLNEMTEKNREIIKHLNDMTKKFEESKFYINEVDNIISILTKTIIDLKTYDVILIPFIGSTNSGKTTIINGIIGKEILPTDLNECTKRGIIIRYSDENEDDITIRKASFKEEKFLDKTSYFFQAEKLIGKGTKQVRETLQGLNLDFNKNNEDSFYYIRTKIKLFDDLGLSDYYKKMIYLIDFPGYGTGNIFETEIYSKVMSICNAFIFVVRNSVIKENDAQKILDSMFTQIKQQKRVLADKFIKSCLFIFNNDNKQSTTDKEIEIAKNDITEVIKGVNKKDLNLVFFNAKYYCNYCTNFNYFFNIENLLRMQHANFIVYKSNIFTYPELFSSKKYNTFGEYIYKELTDRIKNEEIGTGKVKGNQKVNKGVHEKIDQIIKKYNLMNSDDYTKFGKYIEKVICYGQDNINTLKTLKESNIEEFKKVFISQINCINNEMQEDIKEKIEDVIKTLDTFFSEKEERDSKEEEKFVNNIKSIIEKMNLLIESSNKEIEMIIKEIKSNIISSLKQKEKNISNLLAKKNYNDILNEVNNEISKNLEKLNKWIEEYIEKHNSESEKLFYESKELLKFLKGDLKLIFKTNFKTYFSKTVGSGTKDIAKEIYDEIINSTESLGNILIKNGFISFFKSLFSNYHYLSNILNIVINTYLTRVNKVLLLLGNSFKNYISGKTYSLNVNIIILEMKFNDEQLEIWKKLFSFYNEKKRILLKINQ